MGLFSLNNQQVAKKVSKVVYKNLYQDLIHKDNYGMSEKFVKPEDTNAASVDIFVPVPIKGRFRMRGAETNGLWANRNNLPDAATGQRKHLLSKRFTIDILKRYDENIAVSEDEVEGVGAANLDESFEQICRGQIEQDIAVNINGYTFASQLYSFFMDSFSDTPTASELKEAIELYKYDSTNKTAAQRAFLLSNAKVSNGDSKLYAGYYPADARQAFLFSTVYPVDLKDTCALNASDVATRMMAGGGINAFTSEKKTVADFEKGAIGWLDGMGLYQALRDVQDAMYYYLGLNPETDAATIDLLKQLACMIAPSNATLRGLKPTSFKTVDDPDVQGVIIQPKINMGVRCLSGNSLKAIFNGKDFEEPAKALESIHAIRDAIKGKFVLPNLSYDLDPMVGADSTLVTGSDGAQTMTKGKPSAQ